MRKNAIAPMKNTWLMCCLLAVLLYGCASPTDKQIHTIYFSQCTGLDLWRQKMLAEMRTELSLHSDLEFLYTDARGDSRLQVQQISRMLLEKKIDVLIISPNEAHPLTPIVEEAYNKGIPVITIDRKTSSPLYTTFIGADNYEMGKMAARYLGSVFHGKTNVLEVMGLAGSSPTIERANGFSAGLADFPNIHLKDRLYGDWLKTTAEARLEADSAELKDIDVIFAHNDNMGYGARMVLDKLEPGKHTRIIGMDALPGHGGGMEMVSDHVLNASLVYPTLGKEAILTAIRILNKETVPKENILKSFVVDSNNVQLMKMQYNKIVSQQNDIEKQQQLLAEQRSVYRSQQIVLNIIVISLVLALVFGGLAFFSLKENRKINKSLEAKNSEIQDQRNQLIEISAKAAEATEARLNFFTNVSHEFRTPLTLMLSPLSDMLSREKLSATGIRNTKLIQQNTYRLLKLVNQLIDYRKIEIDKQRLKATENNLVSYVQDITNSFTAHAKKNNVHLYFSSPQSSIKVWFDTELLDKVIFNLISNAIKFSREDGHVTVTVGMSNDNQVFVKVEDNGVGIYEKEIPLVFDQFYQADNAPVIGSGIGLSLAREIIRLHHGTIEVKSQKWKSTTFTILLPIGDQHLGSVEKAQDSSMQDSHQQLDIYQGDLEKISYDEGAAFTAPKELSVLLIEDNTDLLDYLKEQFSAHFEVFTASNGNDGLSQAYEKLPDLIISDVVLPNQSGKEITRILKSDFRTSHIPIILLTAQTSIEQQISGLNAMADLYITKPFHFHYLLAGVNTLLKNRILLKNHYSSEIPQNEKPPVARSLDKKFLSDLAGIVEQNLGNEQFSIEDICKLIGISRMQLYRKTKALLDCSVSDYILARRLRKAQYLLKNEDLSISEVTYMVGFSNPNYFSTVFKSKYGCTPSEYRRS